MIGETTAQGYTGVWIATCDNCWVVGLGSRLFEQEVMRAIDPTPPTFSDALRYFVSFHSGSGDGALEVRDVYAGKSLSQPSVGVRHVLHVRCMSIDAESSSLPQKRSLADMTGARLPHKQSDPTVLVCSNAAREGAQSQELHQSQLKLLEHAVFEVDQGADIRPIPSELYSAGPNCGSGSFLVVCSSASLSTQVAASLGKVSQPETSAAATTERTSSCHGQFEARSMLSLLAEGWGAAVGFPMPKLRNQSLCAIGVQRLVGRVLDR